MWPELRFACRTLLQSPTFALTAVAALALGIGANSAVFSVVNAALLNPAGISEPDRILAVRVHYDKLNLKSIPMSAPDFVDVRNSTQLFAHAAVLDEGDFHYTGSGVPERLQGASVSLQWFDVFRARPHLGRVFQPEEDQPDANQVVVLAYPTWKRIFGGDPSAVGRTIELNQKPYRIVGVMGPDFRWPSQVDLWVPLGLSPQHLDEQNRFNEGLFAVARMKPGVSLAQGNALLQVLSDRVRNNGTRGGAYAKDSAWGMFAVPMTDFIAGETKTPMLVLLGAVALVLLIACSNIAGLMLARASGRAREIAIRAALGAGRWDLIRQILWESLLLAIAGAILGLFVAHAGIRLMTLLAPENVAASFAVSIDRHVLAFTAGLTVLAGMLFGIAPAWQLSGIASYELLKEGGRSATAGRARQRLRAGLVVGEVALALVLLVGAGLFLRSLARLQQADPGFDPRGVLTANLSLPRSRYQTPEQRLAFFQATLERLSQMPGASVAAAGVPLPFSGGGASASFRIEGREVGPGDPGPHGDVRYISPGYFAALRIPLRSGRVFTEQDRTGSQPVVVIDENLARQYWPNEDPLGRRMGRGRSLATIIGVVGHVKHSDLAGDTGKGVYYYPVLQQPTPFTSLLVKTASNPASLAGGIRDAVRAVDPALPVQRLKTMEDLVSNSLAPRRFVVVVLAFFAVAALLLAAIGLYGLISYSVAQRTQEIGIRIALGAQAGQVLALVVGQGARFALAGVAIGFVAAFSLSRLLASQLYQVSPFDPMTSVVTAAVLIVAALAASYLPARRATRVDPVEALRHE